MKRLPSPLALSLALVPCFASVAVAQDAEPVETQAPAETQQAAVDVIASQFKSSSKDHVAIDVDAHGRTVAVWQSRRQQEGTYGVYARRFDRDGSPLGDEVQINATTAGHQTSPAVALDDDGTAWFVWTSHGQDGDMGGIVARRFDAALQSATPELLVNTQRAGDQREPSIDSDGAGNAVVIWEHLATPSGQQGLRARRLTPNGKPLGEDEFAIELEDAGSNKNPSVTMAADGRFAVVWARIDETSRPVGIFGRHFDAQGSGSAELQISPEALHAGIEPVVTSIDGTHSVVLWLDGHGGEYQVAFRRVEWNAQQGESLGAVRSMPACDDGYLSGASIAARADGSVALAWNVYGNGAKHHANVWLATFDAHNAPLREAFAATVQLEGTQHIAAADGTRSLVFGDDGTLVIGWSGDAGLGDHKGAHLSMHAAEGQTLVASSAAQEPAQVFEQPAKPHVPPTFTPPTGVVAVDRTPITHPLTATIGFPGIANTGWTPPDPDMAVGPNHLVQVTNGAIAFFDKAGALLFQDAIEGANGFWGNQGATGFVFDPEARYDPHTDRFFAMANERASNGKPYFLLAVSDDSNPQGAWHKYRIDVQSAAGDSDIDSPNMGIDDEAVYLTADFFGPDKFLVFIVEKAPLLIGGPVNSTSLVLQGQQSLGLPLTYDAGAPQFMVWAPETSTASTLEIFAINDPLGNPSLVSTTVSIPTYAQPENPPQMGTSVRPETFEARIWSSTFRNGSLWASHHFGSNRIRQRWYEFDMGNWPVSGAPTLVQTGTVDPGAGIRTFFGSLAVDAAGNMGLSFSRSATDEFISMGVAYRAANDPLGTTRPMVIVKESTSADNSGRWGDYSGIGADPNNVGEFWGVHEYRTGSWRTWIQNFQVTTPVTNYCSTSPNSAGAGAVLMSGGSVSEAANDFVLTVSGAPSSVQGLFFFGFLETQVPFGNGFRCVDGAIQRLPVTATDSLGIATLALDLNGPHVGGSISAGTTAKFQYWYRDPGVGQNFNLSDALSATFTP